MSFQTIPQSDFASNLGAGFGQGLAEQIPKEVERVRLSQGLKNLGQGLENLSPIEQIAKLAGIPGMNAQTAAAFLPYIQQSQARRALKDRTEKGKTTTLKPSDSSNETLDRSAQPDYLRRPTSETIDELAQKRIDTGADIDVNQARANAREILNDQYAADESREAIKSFGKNLLDEFIKDTGVDISGETRKRFENQASEMLLEGGLSRQRATEQLNNKLLDFSKAQTELRSLASTHWFAKRRKPVQESIQHVRNEYEKLGVLDQFEKDLQSKQLFGYSPEVASQFAFPLSKTPQVNQEFKKLPFGRKKGVRSPVSEKFINHVLDNWSPDIGIKGLGRELELKGYDADDFIKKLRLASGTGKFTQRQERELIKPMSSRRTLGDVWLDVIETSKKV